MHPTCSKKGLNLAEGEKEEDASPALANRQRLLDVEQQKQIKRKQNSNFCKPVDANRQIG
jgi:hypothetical protein